MLVFCVVSFEILCGKIKKHAEQSNAIESEAWNLRNYRGYATSMEKSKVSSQNEC